MTDEDKVFDLHQAEQLLPTLQALLETAREKKLEVEAIDQEFSQVHNRILLHGGILPPYAHLAEKRLQRDAALETIRDAVSQIERLGCVVKDLDVGLVDFPARRDNQTVYLCWKLGEEYIGYWHHTDEGFAGRKPLGLDSSGRARTN